MASAAELEEMKKEAVEAAKAAYAPYSKFRVGCSVRGSDGRRFSGCNVENVSYGLTICAERTALVKAVSEGVRSVTDVVVACVDLPASTGPGFPCGACRQFIVEFGAAGRVHCVSAHDLADVRVLPADQLLPHAFTPQMLPNEGPK